MKILNLFNAVIMGILISSMSQASESALELQKMLHQVPLDQVEWKKLPVDVKVSWPKFSVNATSYTLDDYSQIVSTVRQPFKQYASNLLDLLRSLSVLQKEHGPTFYIDLCKLVIPAQLHACQKTVKSYRQIHLFPNMANNVEYRSFMGDVNYTPYKASAVLGAEAIVSFNDEAFTPPADLSRLYETDIYNPYQLMKTLWDFSAYAKYGLEMSGLAAFATGQFQKIPGSSLADISQYADSRTWLELADLLSPKNTNVTQFNPNTGYDRSALYRFVLSNYNAAKEAAEDAAEEAAEEVQLESQEEPVPGVNPNQDGGSI